jgi:hypothetical protein
LTSCTTVPSAARQIISGDGAKKPRSFGISVLTPAQELEQLGVLGVQAGGRRPVLHEHAAVDQDGGLGTVGCRDVADVVGVQLAELGDHVRRRVLVRGRRAAQRREDVEQRLGRRVGRGRRLRGLGRMERARRSPLGD